MNSTIPALAPPGMPRNAVVVLLDSLNRHLLGAYGSREFATPNLDRFAARAVRLDNHYSGSLPCMPARHDLLCGALDFLWKPWGSIELWEDPITVELRRAGVTTMLVSDHPHLFEVGGENYHCDFTAWDYQRGHESDPWRTRPDTSWAGAPAFNRSSAHYDNSRGHFRDEADFPGPRTLAAAARWLRQDAPSDTRFMLFIDEFDPHEPFDTPEPWASMYDPDWQGPHLIWPPYSSAAVGEGVLTARQARQIRACYGAKLSMIDHWFGHVLDALDERALWQDTAVIVCTDHGHYLGERDAFGKPPMPIYEPLGHIPLLIAWPGVAPGARSALTTSVDIHATLLDLFGVGARQRTHGHSLVPLLRGEVQGVRDWALSGYWGREVHLLDGRSKYVRAPVASNTPLSLYSNRWSTMPVAHWPELRLPLPDERAVLSRMPGSPVPVIRQPYGADDRLPFWALGRFDGHKLFDLQVDPAELHNLADTLRGHDAAERLRAALQEVQAPADQFQRLGLG